MVNEDFQQLEGAFRCEAHGLETSEAWQCRGCAEIFCTYCKARHHCPIRTLVAQATQVVATTGLRDQEGDTLGMRILKRADDQLILQIYGPPGPSAVQIDMPIDELSLLNLGSWFIKAAMDIHSRDVVKVQDEVKIELQPSTGRWKLKGYDTFEGGEDAWYPLGDYASRAEAEEAAERRLEELERSQPGATSGGQSGIQDRVYIVAPDGGKYRYVSKK